MPFGEKAKAGYPIVPLRSEKINVVILQSHIRHVDVNNPQKTIKENLDHMMWMIDRARGQKDLVVFHEFPINGLTGAMTRPEQLKTAIDIPGPETEILGKKAKQYNCYIQFGCYGKLPDWPDHFFNMGVIVGPTGEVLHKKWKLRNMAGMGFSTTVFDVLDEYVKRYGWDEVFPIARTDIGNIAIMPCVYEPEIARVFACKGAEILIRYMTAGNGFWPYPVSSPKGAAINSFRIDFQATCLQNQMWGLFVNNALSPEVGIDDVGAGGSSIYNPDGQCVVEALSPHETAVWATIPIAQFRAERDLPKFPKELFANFYETYVSKYPPNSFLKTLPGSFAESGEHYRKIQRW
ncbi:MAG: nitrilase-related carbon-nitrogen hydrolase [Chloroflexota bacterium]